MTMLRIDGLRAPGEHADGADQAQARARFYRIAAFRRSLRRRPAPLALVLAAGTLCASTVIAQAENGTDATKDPSEWVESEAGIPVTDPLTIQKCGTCHLRRADDAFLFGVPRDHQ